VTSSSFLFLNPMRVLAVNGWRSPAAAHDGTSGRLVQRWLDRVIDGVHCLSRSTNGSRDPETYVIAPVRRKTVHRTACGRPCECGAVRECATSPCARIPIGDSQHWIFSVLTNVCRLEALDSILRPLPDISIDIVQAERIRFQ
jgi:hypothetical protein